MRCSNVCLRAVCRNGSTVDGVAIRAAAGSFTVSFAAYRGTDGGGAGMWGGGNFASSGIFGGSAGTTLGGTGFGGAGAAVGGVAVTAGVSAGFKGGAGASGCAGGATWRGGSAALGIPVGKGAGINCVCLGITVAGGGISAGSGVAGRVTECATGSGLGPSSGVSEIAGFSVAIPLCSDDCTRRFSSAT